MTPERQLIADATAKSPYGSHLGLACREMADDLAIFDMAYDPRLTTIGTMVHGGAIASLVDAAATAAAWATPALPENPRGSTIGFAINYLNAALEQDLTATARTIRRGGSVVVVQVEIADPHKTPIAVATVTYKLSGKPSAKSA